jgi:hypothetical protein
MSLRLLPMLRHSASERRSSSRGADNDRLDTGVIELKQAALESSPYRFDGNDADDQNVDSKGRALIHWFPDAHSFDIGHGGRRGSVPGDDNLGCTIRNKDVVNDGREGVFHGCGDDSI